MLSFSAIAALEQIVAKIKKASRHLSPANSPLSASLFFWKQHAHSSFINQRVSMITTHQIDYKAWEGCIPNDGIIRVPG